jgi:arylsulfatase B
MTLLSALLLMSCGPADSPHGVVVTRAPLVAEASDAADDTAADEPRTGPRRVLLIIADDLGVDSLATYADQDGDGLADDGRSYAPTPTIDGLCADGVRYNQAWAYPTCSPSRATMLTGRFGMRTGVGHAIPPMQPGLDLDEPTLPRWLAAHPELGVATAAIGKWHLGATEATGGDRSPNEFGWTHFAGNLQAAVGDYSHWLRTVDGDTAFTTTYATTAQVDDALSWLDGRETDEDWLLWVGLVAPHEPFHAPPTSLHSYGPLSTDPADIAADPVPYYQASLESADTEIERLLDGLDARGMGDVDIIFIGDNGTPSEVVQAPWVWHQAKETLFEGGVHVPVCVSGPSVAAPGRTSEALVHVVDIFATVGEVFGLDPVADLPDTHTFDSASFFSTLRDPDSMGARAWSYSEGFGGWSPTGEGVTARDERVKVIRWDDGSGAAYDLLADPLETEDLMGRDELNGDLSAHIASLDAVLDGLELNGAQ